MISSTTSKIEYVGNGATTVFAYTFPIQSNTWLKVYVSGVLKTLTTDYTVSGVGTSSGNVTFLSAPASSAAIYIARTNIPATQLTDYIQGDPFPADSHEQALDKLTTLVSQLVEGDTKSIKIPAYEDSTVEFGSAASRASKMVLFDTLGNLTVDTYVPGNPTTTFIASATGAVARSYLSKNRDILSVKDFGAVGDGVTDDTISIQAAADAGQSLFIPYTSPGYLISSTITFKSDVFCEGKLITAAGFASTAVTFNDAGYGVKRYIHGLYVESTSTRAANSFGIVVPYPSVILDRCTAFKFEYGIQVKSYSIMLMNCSAFLNSTNLSAYAPSSTSEINDLKIIGGNYDSGGDYNCRIADPRFSTTVADGNAHGVSIKLMGANFDGAVSTFDRVFNLSIDTCYYEGAASNNGIELGGVANGSLRVVEINNCYFSTLKNAIYCNTAVRGLTVYPNHYATITYCGVYAVNVDFAGVNYYTGVTTAGFGAQELHTGFTNTTESALTFASISNESEGLVKGVQTVVNATATSVWYPYGQSLTDGKHNLASSLGRVYNSPATTIAGTMSGSNFTCTTAADALAFNGGDKCSGANGATFVRYVDYANGIIVVNATGSGALTISQLSSALRTISIAGSAAPVSGAYLKGDIVYNAAPDAGGFIGWVCTTAGSPGTWKTFGVITS